MVVVAQQRTFGRKSGYWQEDEYFFFKFLLKAFSRSDQKLLPFVHERLFSYALFALGHQFAVNVIVVVTFSTWLPMFSSVGGGQQKCTKFKTQDVKNQTSSCFLSVKLKRKLSLQLKSGFGNQEDTHW